MAAVVLRRAGRLDAALLAVASLGAAADGGAHDRPGLVALPLGEGPLRRAAGAGAGAGPGGEPARPEGQQHGDGGNARGAPVFPGCARLRTLRRRRRAVAARHPVRGVDGGRPPREGQRDGPRPHGSGGAAAGRTPAAGLAARALVVGSHGGRALWALVLAHRRHGPAELHGWPRPEPRLRAFRLLVLPVAPRPSRRLGHGGPGGARAGGDGARRLGAAPGPAGRGRRAGPGHLGIPSLNAEQPRAEAHDHGGRAAAAAGRGRPGLDRAAAPRAGRLPAGGPGPGGAPRLRARRVRRSPQGVAWILRRRRAPGIRRGVRRLQRPRLLGRAGGRDVHLGGGAAPAAAAAAGAPGEQGPGSQRLERRGLPAAP